MIAMVAIAFAVIDAINAKPVRTFRRRRGHAKVRGVDSNGKMWYEEETENQKRDVGGYVGRRTAVNGEENATITVKAKQSKPSSKKQTKQRGKAKRAQSQKQKTKPDQENEKWTEKIKIQNTNGTLPLSLTFLTL